MEYNERELKENIGGRGDQNDLSEVGEKHIFHDMTVKSFQGTGVASIPRVIAGL